MKVTYSDKRTKFLFCIFLTAVKGFTAQAPAFGHHDNQHNDTQGNAIEHNGTQHKGLICDT
jgi:hypothetical protein